MSKQFYAMNRKQKVVEPIGWFKTWEEVQMAFRWGIGMSNGVHADAIGRCKSMADLIKRAAIGGYEVLS